MVDRSESVGEGASRQGESHECTTTFSLRLAPKSFPQSTALADGRFRREPDSRSTKRGLRTGRAYLCQPAPPAVLIEELAIKQDDRRVDKKGPPTRVAFDGDGNATPAATAFAKKCGVDRGRAWSRQDRQRRVAHVPQSSSRARPLPNCCPASSSRRWPRCRFRGACAGVQAMRSSCDPCTGSSCCMART